MKLQNLTILKIENIKLQSLIKYSQMFQSTISNLQTDRKGENGSKVTIRL
jgi:hypothetical protein